MGPNKNIEAEWNGVTMHLQSDKIPTFEECTHVNEEVVVIGNLTDEEIVKSLTINEDAPSDDYNEE